MSTEVEASSRASQGGSPHANDAQRGLDPERLADQALSEGGIRAGDALRVLRDPQLELPSLVAAAYRVRRHYFGKTVQVHVINNAANGHCPEDCNYCSQAKTSAVDIETYPSKRPEEVLREAQRAYESGAHRYCMVYAGRGPNHRRTEQLAELVRSIKARFNMEVCVSAGLLDPEQAKTLKAAGLDRYNHNLNTARDHYPSICSSHTYEDRLRTLGAAQSSGLEICSGLIVGMGESDEHVVEVAATLQKLGAKSIPVNFLLSFDGTPITPARKLSPEYCVRVLCAFRLMNPQSEVRIAAGREQHLRSLQPMALYPANSLFLDGYLNARGAAARTTLQMIQDLGMEIVSEFELATLLDSQPQPGWVSANALKTRAQLRPSETAAKRPSAGE